MRSISKFIIIDRLTDIDVDLLLVVENQFGFNFVVSFCWYHGEIGVDIVGVYTRKYIRA